MLDHRSFTVVGVALIVLAACVDQPTAPDTPPEGTIAFERPAGRGPGGGGGGQDQPLTFDYFNAVTISDGTVVTAGVRNDERQTIHGTTYVDGECAVQAALRNGTDGWLVPGSLKIKRKDAAACDGTDPRVVLLDLTRPLDGGTGAGVLETTAMNLYLDIASIPVGGSALREGKINHGFCGALQYLSERDGVATGADLLLVSRPGPETWIVETPEDPLTGELLDKAWCRNEGEDGRLYHVPLALEIRLLN